MNKLISVCIPTRNRVAYLSEALVSCLSQEYRPLEIVISDDSDGEESGRLLRYMKYPEGISILYSRNDPPLGQAGNVGKLFASAHGDRLILLHDDDCLLPGAVETLDRLWQSDPRVIATYGAQEIVSEFGEPMPAATKEHQLERNLTAEVCGSREDLLVLALWRQFPNNGYLINTEIARNLSYREFDEVGHACDTDFGIRLAQLYQSQGTFVVSNVMISRYRFTPSGLNYGGSPHVVWRLFDIVDAMPISKPEEEVARRRLLTRIAAQAVLENARLGRRSAAMRVFRSVYYRRASSTAKKLFHLAVITAPSLYALKKV